MCKIQPPLNQPPDYQFARLSSTDIRVCIDSKLYSKKKKKTLWMRMSPHPRTLLLLIVNSVICIYFSNTQNMCYPFPDKE